MRQKKESGDQHRAAPSRSERSISAVQRKSLFKHTVQYGVDRRMALIAAMVLSVETKMGVASQLPWGHSCVLKYSHSVTHLLMEPVSLIKDSEYLNERVVEFRCRNRTP
ncbi:hypothetical protein BJY01DRAFT_128846 [Aspergillus pseudoustus]|uniref:Uncharacterized protein n=1 Tax=Aspergillus pseudoustus TaxID=1810923 RepID=A0ABR4IM06_9EURO